MVLGEQGYWFENEQRNKNGEISDWELHLSELHFANILQEKGCTLQLVTYRHGHRYC